MRAASAFFLLSCAVALAAEPPPYINEAAQDGMGVVWACSLARQNQLFTFDGRSWTIHEGPFEPGDRAMPLDVVGMPDGSIDCIWKVGDHGVSVSRHTATESRVLGNCVWDIRASPMSVQPLADSQNRLWITGDFPVIYRADSHGLKLMHQVTREEVTNPNDYLKSINPIRAVEDGRGRIWMWSDPLASNWARLRGVLIFTGDTPELHTAFSTVPGGKVLAIARADDRHMWIAVAGDGIFRVDIDSFTVQREKDPTPKALDDVHELHVDGGDLYAVQDVRPFSGSLWRRRDGHWTCLVPNFSREPISHQHRSWLPVPGGLLVEDFGSAGPWYIPHDGPPAQFSWRTGFPQMEAHALMRLKDGSFFSLGREGEPFHGALNFPPKERTNERVTDMHSEVPWVVDSAKRVWFIPADAHQTLSQWDGEKWIPHAIPGPAEQSQMPPYILPDTEARLWLQDEGSTGVLQIYDTTSGQWQTFAKLEDAYLQMKDHPPHFPDNSHFIVEPAYSADRERVAFRRGVGELDYYDGVTWQKLARFQITGEKGDAALGPPWFSTDGSLMVNVRPKQTWRMAGPGKWAQVPFQSHYPDDIWSEDGRGRSFLVPAPEGCVTRNPDSCVQDNLGTYWLTWKGQLYRAVPNHWVTVFAPGEANPFTVPQQLRKVFIDSRGNALIESAAYRMDWFIVRAKAPPPHTTLSLTREGADSFLAHLDAHTPAPVTYHWQLDDGPWRDADANPLPLENLPNGNHKLQVTATDDQLDTDPKSARVAFSVQIDPAAQMADLLAQLANPDYAKRKAAVEAFALQPISAESTLRKARETANDDLRWWIDVALQEIETHHAKPAN